MTPFNPCSHGVLQVIGFNALGATVGCVNCNETFDLPADTVEEKYYPFRHNSPLGEDNDVVLLLHESLMIKA